jgi:hypothetical protein
MMYLIVLTVSILSAVSPINVLYMGGGGGGKREM